MSYSYSTGYDSMSAISAIFSGVGSIISIAIIVVTIIAWWKMFEKAGLEGWKALIPFYNTYCLYQMAFGRDKGWMFVLTLVPCVNVVIQIIFCLKLAQAFNKGTGYGLGLIFLNTIFVLLLGFGDAQYVGDYLR